MNLRSAGKWLAPVLVLLLALSLWWRQAGTPLPESVVEVSCQPEQGDCVAELSGGRLVWSVAQPIVYLQPFVSQVELLAQQSLAVRQVSVEFLMPGMHMAVNRSVFDKQSEHRWQAQSVLPVCVSGRKDWLAVVRVETAQGNWQVAFKFMLPARQD